MNPQLLNLISPLAGKFAADLVRKVGIKHPLLAKPVAIAVGAACDIAIQYFQTAHVNAGQAALMGGLSVLVNEIGNDVKTIAADKPAPVVAGGGVSIGNTTLPLILASLFLPFIIGCANTGATHLSRQTVTGMHIEVPSTTTAGASFLKFSLGRIQNVYANIPTNAAAFTSAYQTDVRSTSPIFGSADVNNRDSLAYGTATTTEVGGKLLQRTATNQFNAVLSLTQ